MAFGAARPRGAPVGSYRVFDSRSTVATMGLKFWHLLVVGALAVSAVAAVVHIGRGATKETKTVASVATTMPAEVAKQAAAANVRSAIPSLEAFYADHGTYGGAASLRCGATTTLDRPVREARLGRDGPLLRGEHRRGPDGEPDRARQPDRARRLLAAPSGAPAFDPRTHKSPPAADILRTRRECVPPEDENPRFAGASEVGGTGLEPVTPSLSSWCSPN